VALLNKKLLWAAMLLACSAGTGSAQTKEITAEQCAAIRAGAKNMIETNVLFQRAGLDLTKASVSVLMNGGQPTEFESKAQAILDGSFKKAASHQNVAILEAMVAAMNAACGKP
jgi:hypothetical protein